MIRSRLWTRGTTDMAKVKYSHLVEYDEASNKIVITRVFETGKPSLYAELPIDDIRLRKEPSRASAACWAKH